MYFGKKADAVWAVGPRNNALDMGSDLPWKGANSGGGRLAQCNIWVVQPVAKLLSFLVNLSHMHIQDVLQCY